MSDRPGIARRDLDFEMMERRIALSTAGSGAVLSAVTALYSPHTNAGEPSLYAATLSLTSNVTVPDRASGFVKLRFNSDGTQATVFASLSNLSNVSAIVLHVTPTKAVAGSTTGQTVAILLKPGSGSGPFRHVTFQVSIDRFSLIGALVGEPLSQLRDAMNKGRVLVIVQTTNGVDPSSNSTTNPGALQPGNYPTGELSGILEPVNMSRV